MALNFTSLTGGSSEVADTSVDTAEITLAANRIAYLGVCVIQEGIESPNAPTISGWDAVNSALFTDGANYNGRGSIYRRMSGSPLTAVHTIDTGAQTNQAWMWEIIESADADTGGSNGSGATVQSDEANGTSTTPEATLGDFGDPEADQALVQLIACALATITPEASNAFTQRNTTSYSMRMAWALNENLTPGGSLSASVPWGTVALEVKAAAGGSIADEDHSMWPRPLPKPEHYVTVFS